MKYSIRSAMIATAVIAACLGLLVNSPNLLTLIISWMVIPALGFGISWVAKQPLKIRLAVEVTLLLTLLVQSSIIWTPSFYIKEAERCEELARFASSLDNDSPATRAALAREAAWFSRRADALRRRGLWLGLTMGPATRDPLRFSGRDFIYEMGTLEMIERHERVVRQYALAP